ncbi:HNH endonuclease [Brevibacillus brevis]|uniref:HNH endonuclease n=1 Tax=Brevibacillus brevis TaxID=1393 RepID=UPI0007D89EE6|nr:HNH endonuclease [Brevibacillus brevis]
MQNKQLADFYNQNKYSKKRGDYIYYHPECKECSVKRTFKWKYNNYEKHKEGVRKNDAKPKRLEQRKLYSRKSREDGSYQRWRESERGKESISKTMAKNKSKIHEITDKELNELYTYANSSCMYCGMTEDEHKAKFKKRLHKDHAINEGSNKIDNCVLACLTCNSSKRAKDWTEWYTPLNDNYRQARYDRIVKWLSAHTNLVVKS